MQIAVAPADLLQFGGVGGILQGVVRIVEGPDPDYEVLLFVCTVSLSVNTGQKCKPEGGGKGCHSRPMTSLTTYVLLPWRHSELRDHRCSRQKSTSTGFRVQGDPTYEEVIEFFKILQAECMPQILQSSRHSIRPQASAGGGKLRQA